MPSVRERRPPVGTAGRRPAGGASLLPRMTPQGKDTAIRADGTGRQGTPTSGRHSPPEAGGVAYRHAPGWFLSRRCPHPRRWRFRARPRFRSVSIAPLAPLRGAVPAPTGRTGRRSAQFSRWGLPCLRVAPPGGMSARRHVQRRRGAFCVLAGFEKVPLLGGQNVPLGFGRTGSAEIDQGCALD